MSQGILPEILAEIHADNVSKVPEAFLPRNFSNNSSKCVSRMFYPQIQKFSPQKYEFLQEIQWKLLKRFSGFLQYFFKKIHRVLWNGFFKNSPGVSQ